MPLPPSWVVVPPHFTDQQVLEGNTPNVDVTAPGAILALAMMYLQVDSCSLGALILWDRCAHPLGQVRSSSGTGALILWDRCAHPLGQVRSSSGTGALILWDRCAHPLGQVRSSSGTGALILWDRCAHPLGQVRSSSGTGALILWDRCAHPLGQRAAIEEWVAAQVPRIIRTAAAATGGGEEERGAGENEGEGGVGKGAREGGGEGEADVDEEAMALALCNVLAGCCLSIGESHHATCCLSIGESHHATCCLSIGESHHATCCLSIGESHHATCCLSIACREGHGASLHVSIHRRTFPPPTIAPSPTATLSLLSHLHPPTPFLLSLPSLHLLTCLHSVFPSPISVSSPLPHTGLRYAGSANGEAEKLLRSYALLFFFLRERRPLTAVACPFAVPLLHWRALLDACTLDTAVNAAVLSLSLVMAGTGHLPSLRLLRFFHRRTAAAADAAAVNAATTYGSHMAVSMAIGFLGLSACQATFSTSPPAVAALLLALFPHFPSSPADHRCHLQALRHFWVLAVEERAFVEAVDVDTWQPVIAPLHLTLKPSDSSTPTALSLHTPCLLPPLPQVLSHSPQVLSHSPQVLSHSPQMIFPLGSGAALAAGVEERQLWEASTHGMYTCPPTNSLCHAAMPLLLPAVTPSFPLLLPAVTPSFPLLLPALRELRLCGGNFWPLRVAARIADSSHPSLRAMRGRRRGGHGAVAAGGGGGRKAVGSAMGAGVGGEGSGGRHLVLLVKGRGAQAGSGGGAAAVGRTGDPRSRMGESCLACIGNCSHHLLIASRFLSFCNSLSILPFPHSPIIPSPTLPSSLPPLPHHPFPYFPHHPFPHSPIIPSPTPPSSLPPLPHHPTPPSSHSPIIPLPHHPSPFFPRPLPSRASLAISPSIPLPCILSFPSLILHAPPTLHDHAPLYTLHTHLFPPLSLSPNLTPVISHTSLHTFPLASLGQLPARLSAEHGSRPCQWPTPSYPPSTASSAAPCRAPLFNRMQPQGGQFLSFPAPTAPLVLHRSTTLPLLSRHTTPPSITHIHSLPLLSPSLLFIHVHMSYFFHEGFSSACQAALLMAHAAEQPELLEVLLSLATTCQAVRSLHHSHTTCGSALPCLVSSFQVTSSCLSPATSFPSTQPCKAEGQGASCGIAGTSSTVTVAYGNTMEFHRRHLEP
ncbi:unnamed protein product [Closterium sp. NIES-65]|nr:unnamed protein product [Closterium sp. NIES-65]